MIITPISSVTFDPETEKPTVSELHSVAVGTMIYKLNEDEKSSLIPTLSKQKDIDAKQKILEDFIKSKPMYSEAVLNSYDTDEKEGSKIIANKLEEFAKERGYDSLMSLISYQSSSNTTYKNEAIYAMQLRDTIWTEYYKLVEQCKKNKQEIPSGDILLATLPTITWDTTVS